MQDAHVRAMLCLCQRAVLLPRLLAALAGARGGGSRATRRGQALGQRRAAILGRRSW